MKICIFSTAFFPNTGGAELAIHNLATQFVKKGHKVTVLVPLSRRIRQSSFSPFYRISRLFFFHDLKHQTFLEWEIFFNLLKTEFFNSFDILQTVISYPPGYCATKLKKILNIPIVLRLTGSDIQTNLKINYGIRLNPKIDKKVRWTMRNIDGLVVNSKTLENEAREAGFRGENFRIIPNGIDFERFKKEEDFKLIKKKILENLGILENEKVLLSVGRNHPKKDYPTLIRTMKEIRKVRNDVRCVIVGGGMSELSSMVKKLDLEKEVIFPGKIPREKNFDFDNYPHNDLVDLYKSANLFVFSSLIEGLPSVAVEAMAAGLPIVACDAPGTCDIVENEKTGFLVPIKDYKSMAEKVLLLLEDKELYKRFKTSALQKIKNYTWSQFADQYLDFYREVRRTYKDK